MNARHRTAGRTGLTALWMFLLVEAAPTGFADPKSAPTAQPSPPAPPATLTNILSIMQLPRQVAAQKLPVDVEGVVTCVYAGDDAFFIYDGQTGVYVGNVEAHPRFTFGERVRVKGTSLHGSFCPMVTAAEVQSLGHGVLPPPPPASFAYLASGSADSQWLEIRGVVQAVTYWQSQQGVSLDFAMDGGTLQAVVEYLHPPDLSSLIDAEVRIRGVASGSFNMKGQMVAPVFRVANISLVQVDKPAQTNWLELPLKHINQILLFSPHASLPHRTRVRGVVTGCQPSQSIYLRDGPDSLKVETAEAADYQPGEVIEVAGFPAMSPYSAELRHAVCQRVGRQAPPQPAAPTLESVLGGLHDAELIKLRAKLLDWVVDDNGVTLALQAQQCLFKGYLMRAQAPASWAIEKNSQVEISGVCDIKELQREVWYYQPRSFSILMRSAQDLTILQQPPWLNSARLWRIVFLLSVLLLTAAVWLWALHREVDRKGALIEHQTKRVAVMEERTRIARDLHDTLEQGLTGLSLQLKAVETIPAGLPPEARSKLPLARRMLSNTKALTHYAVQELRDGVSISETLAAGLERTAQFWNRTGALTVRLNLAAGARALPKGLDEPLLAVAREAMTNAVKHGQATAIEVEVAFAEGMVRLRVQDNGCGFEPTTITAAEGHFGVQGMRERLSAIGGSLQIHSHPGQGTELRVSVPCIVTGGSQAESGTEADTPDEVHV
ncbi:putative Histidine kinase [Verrucomicrobia bacterium]|nr:putative Histidine kinase [Verrucomicrobiota bacterium]